MLSCALAKESVPGPVAGMFYQAVAVSGLLYGSETWVLPQLGMKWLEGFHVEVKRKWVYPHFADVLKAAGLCTVAEYIAKQRSNIARTTEGRRILEECWGAARRRGTPVRMYWWEQELTFEEGGQEGGEGLGFVTNNRDGNAWTGEESWCADAF